MGTKVLRNTYVKIGVILAAVVLLAAALFVIDLQPVNAFSPEYVAWPEYPTNPVFNPVERAYYPSIIFDGSSYKMWYDDGSGIRYTTSADGINWAAGTVVTGLTNGRHPLVKWVGTKYMIWYWNSAGIFYSINDIRTAESVNGITWTSDTAISQVGTSVIAGNPGVNWNAGSYGPCDVFYNPAGSATIVAPVDAATVWQNKYVLYYDGTTGSYEDIGIAVSADGILWQGYNGGVAPGLAHGGGATWDSDYATFCSIQLISGVYHMWYSGGQSESNEGIGYAQSTDGITWTKYASNPIKHKTDGVPWRTDRTYTPRVLYDAASFSGAGEAVQLKMWWNGTAGGDYAIGYSGMAITPPTTTPGPVVGGRVNPVDKTALLMPYLYTLLAIMAIVVSGLVWRKFASERASDRKR
ncbi:MAG: hypothetical protein ACYDG5_05960 [Dehalococcoidales bacterium]